LRSCAPGYTGAVEQDVFIYELRESNLVIEARTRTRTNSEESRRRIQSVSARRGGLRRFIGVPRRASGCRLSAE